MTPVLESWLSFHEIRWQSDKTGGSYVTVWMLESHSDSYNSLYALKSNISDLQTD